MKKMKAFISTILLALVVCSGMQAQNIEIDSINSKGIHTIKTTSRVFAAGLNKYNISLVCSEQDNAKEWNIVIYNPNGYTTDEILLRMGNNELMHLYPHKASMKEFTDEGYVSVTYGNITFTYPHKSVKKLSLYFYTLSTTDLQNIERYGIKKIRISDGTKFYDKSYGFNELGDYLTKCKFLINQQYTYDIKRKEASDNLDIYNDF